MSRTAHANYSRRVKSWQMRRMVQFLSAGLVFKSWLTARDFSSLPADLGSNLRIKNQFRRVPVNCQRGVVLLPNPAALQQNRTIANALDRPVPVLICAIGSVILLRLLHIHRGGNREQDCSRNWEPLFLLSFRRRGLLAEGVRSWVVRRWPTSMRSHSIKCLRLVSFAASRAARFSNPPS